MSHQKKIITSAITIVLSVYFGLLLLIYAKQTNFLFYPQEETEHVAFSLATKNNLQPFYINKKFYGYSSGQESSKNVIIVFHGNAGSAYSRTYMLSFIPKDYFVIFVEYPGYSFTAGDLSESEITRHGRDIIEFYAAKKSNIVLMGESLGAAVVGNLTKDNIDIVASVLITPWDSFANVAHTKFKMYPVWLLKMISKYKFDTYNNIFGRPNSTYIMGCYGDEVIPYKHALALKPQVASGNFYSFNCTHNDWISDETITTLGGILKSKMYSEFSVAKAE